MHWNRCIAPVLMIVATAGLAAAQDHQNIEELTRLTTVQWENGSAVATSGNYAYVLDEGVGVHIVDISYPRSPRPVSEFQYNGSEWGIAAAGELICIAGGSDGIILVDVSSPEDPREIGRYQDVGNARGAIFGDGLLYVASGSDGVFALSIEDPAHPEALGACQIDDFAINLDLAGDLLFVTDRSSGMKIIDVSDPANPHVIGAVNAVGETRDVAVSGDYAYLGETSVVSQIDITDPTQPERITQSNVNQPAMAVAVSGSTLFAALTAYGQLSVRNINNGLQQTGFINYDQGPRDVAVGGGLAWTTSPGVGLKGIDASIPANPLEHGRCGSALEYQSLSAVGDRLYTGVSMLGEMCYNVSDPENPVLIWQNSPIHIVSYCDLICGDGILYAGERAGDRAIKLGDISNPDTVAWISNTEFRGDPVKFALWQDRLYKVHTGGYSYIYDVSNWGNVREIGSIHTDNARHQNIAVVGTIAYVTTSDAGLLIYDVADYTQPRLQGSLNLNSEAAGIVVRGDIAYVGFANGMAAVNIRDPRQPALLGRIDLPDKANEIVLEGEFAVVACDEAGVRVISIANPQDMTETGYFDTPSKALDVALIGQTVAVADLNGLGFYECSVAFEENHAPFWDAAQNQYTIEARQRVEFTVQANDDDNDSLSISLDAGGMPEGYLFRDRGDGSADFSWEPEAVDTGSYLLTITAFDGRNHARLGISIEVNLPNQSPGWDEDQTEWDLQADSLFWLTLTASDPDQDSLRISLTANGLPEGYQLRDNGGGTADFVWQPNAADSGTWRPEFVVSDGLIEVRLLVVLRVHTPNGIGAHETGIPLSLCLSAPFPNPFNSSTTISYTLPRPGRNALSVVDITGREVAKLSDGWKEAGSYRSVWNAGTLANGNYILILNHAQGAETMRVSLVR